MRSGFKIVPYTKIDGIPTFRDSDIRELYLRVERQKLRDILFHDGSIMSADDWSRYITGPGVLLFIVIRGDDKLGFFWLNRIERTTAFIHFCAFKEVWGTKIPVNSGRRALSLLLNMRDADGNFLWHTIMGMTPEGFRVQLRYIRRCGMKVVGTVPNLMWDHRSGKPKSGILSFITREGLLDEDLS
jgi:RimJ/RimL family protein N-acetyltransferase